MGILTPAALHNNWKINRFAKVYLFAEQNTFEKERHRTILTSIIFPAGLTPFNHDTISFPGASVEDVINSALMLPFSEGKRFIYVKNVHQVRAAQEKLLAEELPNLPATTIVIFESNKTKKDNQKSILAKTIAKLGDIVYFWRPRMQDIPRMISKKVVESGKTIAPEAARFIAEDTGDDQAQLMMEIEKLLLYCRDTKVIGLKEAAEVCGQTAVHNLFELRDSLQARNVKKSIAILEYLLQERVEPIKIINSLYQAYRRLLVAKLMIQEKKMSKDDIVPALGINTYYEKHFFSDLNHFELDELINNLERIREADVGIKTGKADPECTLAVLILRLSGCNELMKLQR